MKTPDSIAYQAALAVADMLIKADKLLAASDGNHLAIYFYNAVLSAVKAVEIAKYKSSGMHSKAETPVQRDYSKPMLAREATFYKAEAAAALKQLEQYPRKADADAAETDAEIPF